MTHLVSVDSSEYFFRTSFDGKLHGFHFKHIPSLEFLYCLCFYEVVVTFKLNMRYLIRKILTFKLYT